MSRLHLLTGIGSYVTAPLWLLFLLVGILISLQAQYVRPEYFPAGFSLFPRWPAQDPIRAAWVFGGTMALLVAPKFLGFLAMLLRKHDRFGMGGALRGFVSLVIETIISALMAPIMMVMQSKAVAEILIGADAGWQVQRRDDGGVERVEVMRRYLPITFLGLILAAAAYAVSQPLFLWMLPVTTGLVFAPVIVELTSMARVGAALRSAGLLLTLEERSAPQIAIRASQLAAEEVDGATQDPFSLLMEDRRLYDAHRQMLPPPEKGPPGHVNVDLVVALAKIANASNVSEALSYLTRGERAALLADAAALDALFAKLR
jgi:membrane glycosyltransferase